MSSASRRDTRKILMRTAATALIAASPFVYSGAASAATTSPAQLTAPTLKSGKQAKAPLLYSVNAANFQLTAPNFQGSKLANPSLGASATLDSFKLNAPTLAGFGAAAYGPVAANQPVQNLLAVPMDAQAGPATISASAFSITTASITPAPGTTTVNNSDDLTLPGDPTYLGDEAAIAVDGGQNHVVINNTGDLTGEGGINVSTGAFDINTAEILKSSSESYSYGYRYRNFYDAITGEYVKYGHTAERTVNDNRTYVNADTSDATIAIDNGGRINFSGLYGIKAENETGESVTIANSGDITASSDTDRRVGIYASVRNPSTSSDDFTEISPGDFTYNADGQLTGVVEYQQGVANRSKLLKYYDGGTINITNTANIDMGETVLTHFVYDRAPWSTAIVANGDGGITINNSGDLKVGDSSQGIRAIANGNVTINNSGTIEVGNGSLGIVSGPSGDPEPGGYRLSGDVTIVNSGDIRGGLTHAEAQASPNLPYFDPFFETVVYGMASFNLGSNNEYVASLAHKNLLYTEYNQQLHDYKLLHPEFEYTPWSLFDIPKTKLYTTTLINEGTIALKDGARGIHIANQAGFSNAINRGTIVVGAGSSDFEGNVDFAAAGIHNKNNTVSGVSSLYSLNEKGAVIVTGDDGAGIDNWSYRGNSVAINEGSITTGDGVFKRITNYYGETYDKPFLSHGILSVVSGGMGTTSYVRNSGDISVGDLAIGATAIGQGYLALNPYKATAAVVNDENGVIIAGDDSTGIYSGGTNSIARNAGSVVIGDHDLSEFIIHPDPRNAGNLTFRQPGYGMVSSARWHARAFNEGTITTGDGTIGMAAVNWAQAYGQGYTAAAYQGEAGIISTGDHSIGVRVDSTRSAYAVNEGRISVGDYSTGAELTGGTAGWHLTSEMADTPGSNCAPPGEPATLCQHYVSTVSEIPATVGMTNAGLIETGDKSVGVRLAGIKQVPYSGEQFIKTDYYWNGYTNSYGGTAEVVSSVFLDNVGTIRVGVNSTAVEITGTAAGPDGAHLRNFGMIDASARAAAPLGGISTLAVGDSAAIKINIDNNLGSKIVNAGTIVGDIILGDGDDIFQNAQLSGPNGASTGNIIMDGARTIDFGAGNNLFELQGGFVSFSGVGNLITGANMVASYGYLDGRNNAFGDSLTFVGDVSGDLRVGVDLDAQNATDHLLITGDVAGGSTMGIVINPTEQLKGEFSFTPVTVDGEMDSDVPQVVGGSGLYADSFVSGEARFDTASGDVLITATFGLGHIGTAANAAAVSAGNWLAGSMSSYGHRNINAYTGRKGEGLAIWHYDFQDEGRIKPDSDLQDLSFSQISTGMQAGVQWSKDIAGGHVSVSPMVTYGTVEANLRANTSSSRGHPWAVGLNANYAMDGGLYVDATYQRMKMDVDLKAPQTATNATGDAKVNGQGFNLEAGYSHKLKSAFVIEPQLQLTHTKVELDDFSSSDDIYDLSDIDGKVTTLRAGLSVYKVFETANGSITPLASVSYLNTLHGKTGLASNRVDFDSDTSGSGYKAEIGLLGRYHAWDFAGKIGVSKTSATGSILQPNLSIRRSFGGAAKADTKTAAVPQLPEVTEATVKFAEAGNTAMAPLATAASAEDAAPVVSASFAQTGAEPTDEQKKKDDQPQQASPELSPEPTPENPMDAGSEPAADEVADEATDIVVTGSLIRRSTATESTPITVITSEDMAKRGLMTLGEVMKSFTQNEGVVQGKASNLLGRFTFGAEEINFRGLGAGRTLVLVNGRRIADYPLPFGGEQNGVDLGTIPYSAIAKVEYLSAGASATYGSDAVGGVVNIITKRDMEQTSLELTGGLYQQGFGETGRIAAITGNSYERGSFTIGAEGYYSGEILASDSKYFRKNAPFNAGMIDILENTAAGQTSVVPQSACAPLGFKFDNGQCTSNVSDTISLNPKVKQGSAFFDGRYDLTDRIELFATAMGSIGQAESRSNVLFWQGVVGNDDNSAAQFITRGFSEDELGVSTVTVDNNMWTVVAGAKGGIDVGGGTWYWDVAASHASFHTKQTGINLKEEGVKNWILNGATTVTDSPDQRYTYFVDPDFYNNQLVDNIVRPVQPADVDALRGENVMKANSSAQSLTATLNGTFSDLGFLYKPVKFAVRAEYGRQVTEINPDDRTLNTTGEGWFNIGAIEAKGKRSRWAVATELDASVLSNLDVVLGGRYDHYYDDSSITGRFTGQAKFLYRPTDWLKVRGGYGQTFRAPDMFNIYGRSDAFEFVPDFSKPGCFDGSTYTCNSYQIASTRQADPNLKEEHGDDLGLGVIVNPLPGFQFTVDWYKIHLKDLVLTESAYDVVLKEWQCANGVLDATSALCADINSRVIRNGFDALERVIVQPINQSDLTRSGFDIQASYSYESAKLGAFNFNLGYSKVTKFELTRFKGDDPIDLKYGEPGSATPGNTLNFSLNWFQPLTTGKGIAAGLFVQRTGRVYNFDQSQFLEPFYDVNLSAAYQLNTKTSIRLNVNNVLNAEPQPNGSGFWPGFWAHLQTANALGRSAYVSIGYQFN